MTEQRLQLITAITDLEHPELRRDKNLDPISLFKQMILKDLFADSDIIEVLHNTDLEEKNSPPEDYHNVNIFSYLKIPGAQSVVKNFICFEVNDVNEIYQTSDFLERDVEVRTVSHKDDVVTEYGINRQDLLAMLVKDRLSWSNYMGMRLQKQYDVGKVAENGYYYRVIRFTMQAPNSMNQKFYAYGLNANRGRFDVER